MCTRSKHVARHLRTSDDGIQALVGRRACADGRAAPLRGVARRARGAARVDAPRTCSTVSRPTTRRGCSGVDEQLVAHRQAIEEERANSQSRLSLTRGGRAAASRRARRTGAALARWRVGRTRTPTTAFKNIDSTHPGAARRGKVGQRPHRRAECVAQLQVGGEDAGGAGPCSGAIGGSGVRACRGRAKSAADERRRQSYPQHAGRNVRRTGLPQRGRRGRGAACGAVRSHRSSRASRGWSGQIGEQRGNGQRGSAPPGSCRACGRATASWRERTLGKARRCREPPFRDRTPTPGGRAAPSSSSARRRARPHGSGHRVTPRGNRKRGGQPRAAHPSPTEFPA